MPKNEQLQALVVQSDVELDPHDTADCERLKATVQKLEFTFAEQARDSGAKTNGLGGLFLGKDAFGKETWAHLISGSEDKYVCDIPHRAVVLLQSIDYNKAVSGSGDVTVSSLKTLAEVTQWDNGIQGKDLEERFKFIYDALVEEAQAESM
jgi:hypothetical protein